MKSNHIVYAILVFGVLVAITSPHLINMALQNKDTTYEMAGEEFTTSTEYNADLAAAIPVSNEQVTIVEEKAPEDVEPLEEETNVPTQEVLPDPIIYDGLTMDALTAKLNRVLRSNLSGTGNFFAKYAIDYGVDPYIAVAISLHETGCNGTCSSAVRDHNNVGGMRSGGGLIHFSTLEEGIKSYVYNLKKNYYDCGLTTLQQINTKYAASKTWASQVERYVNMIKAA